MWWTREQVEEVDINSKLKISKSSYIISLTLDEFIRRIVIWSHMLFRPGYFKNSAVVSFFFPKYCEKRRNSGQRSRLMSSKIFKNFNLKKLWNKQNLEITYQVMKNIGLTQNWGFQNHHKLQASLWTNVLVAEILAEAIHMPSQPEFWLESLKNSYADSTWLSTQSVL